MDEYTFADVDFAVEIEFDEMFSEESEDFTEYEYEDYEPYEDAGLEGYLFGWDAESHPLRGRTPLDLICQVHYDIKNVAQILPISACRYQKCQTPVVRCTYEEKNETTVTTCLA